MDIVEIFSSIEGEGKRAGYLCTFIRFAQCNLRCLYCDTTYSYDLKGSKEYTVEEIVNQCDLHNIRRITLTGGEPLLQQDINNLVHRLLQKNYEVNIETNGSINISVLANERCEKLFFTIDYKCPSSGMNEYMSIENYNRLDCSDVIKFVVSSIEDLDCMRNFIYDYKLMNNSIYISPVWNEIDMKVIVAYLKEHKLENCRLQVQLHKVIWGPEEKGV